MKTIDTLLLLALPASGKSEVRRYLGMQSESVCKQDFHLGETVQLDDFPYVHMMRRIDEELQRLGQPSIFFQTLQKPFLDARDWGTLVQLVNEDYADLKRKTVAKPSSAAALLLSRLDAARTKVGAPSSLCSLPAGVRTKLGDVLEREARAMLDEKHASYPESLSGKTLVIEFARGGKDGSAMPLAAPFGYAYSLGQLSPEILKSAKILYIWVTPEESRRKNQARTNPNDPGSILHHGVPEEVMLADYGCDDIGHLLETSRKPNTIELRAHGKTFHLPVARFDNRVDKTSFVRNPKEQWQPAEVEALHGGLKAALTQLAEA